MLPASAPPRPAPRILARGRPSSDPRCAGCDLLGAFRALRRAGLDAWGAAGCDPDASPHALRPPPGRFAAVTGAAAALADPSAILAGAARSGARLVVVADRGDGAAARAIVAALGGAGARASAIDPRDLAEAEQAARAAAEESGSDAPAALVALAPCARRARRAPPVAIAPSRCNRCGACLALGCAAMSDAGGEAMVVDPDTCTGCRLCALLCRGRAIGG